MKKERVLPYILLLPCLVMVIVLYGYPIMLIFYQSFHQINLLNNQASFVGLDNYRRIVEDDTFYKVLSLTFRYTLVTVSLKMGLGFLFAYLLYRQRYFKKTFRFLTLVPWAIPQVAVATLWKWLLDSKYGYINYYLMKFQLIKQPILFLARPIPAFYSLAFVDAWLGISLVSLMLLASLEQIPQSLYEAAEMDGAGPWRQFVDITLTEMKKSLITVLILVSIWTFNSFNVIFILTQGGPMRSTETLIIKIYQEAFNRFNLGASASLSVIAVLILLILSTIYIRRLNDEKN